MPPNWNLDAERLHSFLEALPGGYRFAFEFRNPSWFDAQVCEMLTDYGAAFCIYQLAAVSRPGR